MFKKCLFNNSLMKILVAVTLMHLMNAAKIVINRQIMRKYNYELKTGQKMVMERYQIGTYL